MLRTTLLACASLLCLAQAVVAYAGTQKPLFEPAKLEAPSSGSSQACQQVSALFPKQAKLDKALERLYNTDAFQSKAQDALGAIIRVP